ncbi:MAG TPA: hypothetical protein VFO60_10380 [Candidatus Dormibacteraeota bacterium]|nr:hypothetical protein [Candidatus Dormibacteraeota bacterium]
MHRGHTHPLSRTASARRCGGDGSRRARPTSTTAESGPSSTRDTFAEQANRCTVAVETGMRPSISPAGAPG